MTIHRSYSVLRRLETFEERFDYLTLKGVVGESTFGFDRWINQQFYRSSQWKHIRNVVIARDEGCDLGIEGHDIFDQVIIHHMNPMTAEQIESGRSDILDPNFLISVTLNTHNAIHYGDRSRLAKPFVARRRNDTKLW